KGLGVFIGQERAPDFQRAAAAHGPVAIHAGEHLLEHRIEEHRLEFLRGGFRLVFLGHHRIVRRLGARERTRRPEGGGSDHHITSISAWMAPAALIACRMVIMSRGPMPSALRPSTTCCSDTPSLTTASLWPSSVTPTRVRATSLVLPRANALGWLT